MRITKDRDRKFIWWIARKFQSPGAHMDIQTHETQCLEETQPKEDLSKKQFSETVKRLRSKRESQVTYKQIFIRPTDFSAETRS